jgi:hypothetical protein
LKQPLWVMCEGGGVVRFCRGRVMAAELCCTISSDFGDAKLVVGALNALTIQLWCTAPTIARTPDLHLGFRLNTWDAYRLLSFFTIILLWLRESS